MRRYLDTLKLFWRISLETELEYRVNFLLSTLTSIGNLTGSLFGLFLFYRTGYSFQGWRWEEALMVLGVYTMLTGFTGTFLDPNLSRLIRHVQRGTLDFVLLKPIDSQFYLSAHTLSPWGLPDLLFGLSLIGYAGVRLQIPPSSYLTGVLPLISGMVILYALWFMLGSTTIWFVKVFNAAEVVRGLLEAGRFPISAYPVAYRFFFTFVVPVAFLTTVPAEAVLGRGHLGWTVGAACLALAMFGLSRLFWKFALRHYTSASS